MLLPRIEHRLSIPLISNSHQREQTTDCCLSGLELCYVSQHSQSVNMLDTVGCHKDIHFCSPLYPYQSLGPTQFPIQVRYTQRCLKCKTLPHVNIFVINFIIINDCSEVCPTLQNAFLSSTLVIKVSLNHSSGYDDFTRHGQFLSRWHNVFTFMPYLQLHLSKYDAKREKSSKHFFLLCYFLCLSSPDLPHLCAVVQCLDFTLAATDRAREPKHIIRWI